MAQITLGGLTTLNLSTQLDPMFSDLFKIREQVMQSGYSPSKAYGTTTINFNPGSAHGTDSLIVYYSDATVVSLLSGISNGPGIQARWDSATANRYLAFGLYDNSSVWVETARFQNGQFLIGRTSPSSSTSLMEIAGNTVIAIPTVAPTLGINGDMSFQLLSNTQLKIVVRGNDGVTRSSTLTLA